MPKKAAQPVPKGMQTVTPVLIFTGNCAEALEFYPKAFNAKVITVDKSPDGKILHGIIKIGDSNVMLSDAFWPVSKGTPVFSLWLYVQDADALYNQAVAAGAEVTMKIEDQFWGDRVGQVKDPYGHLWSIATNKEELTPDEMAQRLAEWLRSIKK